MAAAWSGTIQELIEEIHLGVFLTNIGRRYQEYFKKTPGAGEVSSWKHSAELIERLFHDKKWAGVRIFFEYAMPSGEQRADIICLGGTDAAPRALLLELKRWDDFYKLVDSRRNVARYVLLTNSDDRKADLHPLLQAQRYARQMAAVSKVGSNFTWSYLAVLPNMSEYTIKRLLATKALPKDAASEIFGADNYSEGLLDEAEKLLPAEVSDELSRSFELSAYSPSADLITKFTQSSNALRTQLGTVMDIADIALTDTQMKLSKAVLGALLRGEHALFLVQGGPGSGKTYVALLLVLRALANKKNAQLALYSSRLYAVLEDILEADSSGSSATLISVSTLCHQLRNSSLDLLVCDEAQRLSAVDAGRVLDRAAVTVLFYDEKQRLNPNEAGSRVLFRRLGQEKGFALHEYRLEQSLRCKGGEPYHQWIEKLICENDQQHYPLSGQSWTDDYDFLVVDSGAELIQRLQTYGQNHKVVSVASFTESSGDWNNPLSAKNLRYREGDLSLYWWMSDHEYIDPWTYGRTTDLDRVCSIYGAQGFESDYVGVIWGRDFLFDGQKFVLGNFRHCFDNIGQLVTPQGWCADALTLVQNRYRIFLTRGRLGTVVFCEDEKTRGYLKKLADRR